MQNACCADWLLKMRIFETRREIMQEFPDEEEFCDDDEDYEDDEDE